MVVVGVNHDSFYDYLRVNHYKLKGEYDVNTPGTYPLTFVGVDSSNNISSHDFDLIVKDIVNESPSAKVFSNKLVEVAVAQEACQFELPDAAIT